MKLKLPPKKIMKDLSDICEKCHDTGYYGDNCHGIEGNNEYQYCECSNGISLQIIEKIGGVEGHGKIVCLIDDYAKCREIGAIRRHIEAEQPERDRMEQFHNAMAKEGVELLAALMMLREALALLPNPDENANERFERIASQYYKDTGYLRPGKSDPERDTCNSENVERFGNWYNEKCRAIHLATAKFTKFPEDNTAYLDRLDTARDSQEEPREKEDVFYPGQGEPT